jgi:hypothetical protein
MRFAVDAADALSHARAGLAIAADNVMPGDLYPAELWLNAWHALRLAGHDDDARDALRRGARWLHAALHEQVPEPFRDSFVRANPINQALSRAAAREGIDEG